MKIRLIGNDIKKVNNNCITQFKNKFILLISGQNEKIYNTNTNKHQTSTLQTSNYLQQ